MSSRSVHRRSRGTNKQTHKLASRVAQSKEKNKRRPRRWRRPPCRTGLQNCGCLAAQEPEADRRARDPGHRSRSRHAPGSRPTDRESALSFLKRSCLNPCRISDPDGDAVHRCVKPSMTALRHSQNSQALTNRRSPNSSHSRWWKGSLNRWPREDVGWVRIPTTGRPQPYDWASMPPSRPR